MVYGSKEDVMSVENLGMGALGGFFIAILTALGYRRRISNLEEKKLDKDVFKEFSDKMDIQFENGNRQFKEIKEHLVKDSEKQDRMLEAVFEIKGRTSGRKEGG
jgi:hypothetical protein